MALQFRRGNEADFVTGNLKAGELAFTLDSYKTFMGLGNGSAQQLASLDGWLQLPACTYASSTSFTIAQNYGSILAVGDKIKLVQSGATKYFYVVGVALAGSTTTVTITGGSDYTLANAAITSPYFSKAASPAGFPDWFNWAPTIGAANSMTVSDVAIYAAKFRISGRKLDYIANANATTGGTASISLTFTVPIKPSISSITASGFVIDGGWVAAFTQWTGTVFNVFRFDSALWSIGTSRGFRIFGSYPI